MIEDSVCEKEYALLVEALVHLKILYEYPDFDYPDVIEAEKFIKLLESKLNDRNI